jgi:ABC-type uncharacterized transport system auxiliary subunit
MRPRLAVLTVALVAQAGCGLARRPSVPIRYYSIEPGTPGAAAGEPAGGVLVVRAFESASRYRERIFFRAAGGGVGFHERERWVEPPAEMVARALRRALEAARVARIVAHERLVRRPDVFVEGNLTRFDEVEGPKQWLAQCEVELVVKQAERGEVLLATRLAASRPAKEPTTAAFVEAMNAAVGELTAKATEAVSRALAPQKTRERN